MNQCHISKKLDELSQENKKVRLTLFNGQTYEGWIDIPSFGYGYVLEIPDVEYTLRFYKSHVKKLEVIL